MKQSTIPVFSPLALSGAVAASRKQGMDIMVANRRVAIVGDDGYELPILGMDPGQGYKGGQVFFANDSRFTETYYSEPLTNYLVGWRDPENVEETLNHVAPRVPVGRRFEYKSAVNAEEFLSEVNDDLRALYGDFKKVVYTATDATSKTLNRGLTMIVDLDNLPPGIPNWQNQRAAKLQRRLFRNSLRRAMTALDASAVNTPLNWNAAPAAPGVIPVNPDQDIRDDLTTAADVTGIRPNRLIYGEGAMNARTSAYGSQNNPAGYVGYAGANAEQALATALMVDRVKISKERYQSAANAKTQILGMKAYAFYANDGVDTEDPSNVKRFVSQFSAEQGGGFVRVYIQQLSAKLVAITVEHYELTVVTYTSGIRKYTITRA